MELYILIGMIALCVLLTTNFLFFRVKKGGVIGVCTKALASFGFITLGLLLSFTKMQSSYYANLTICFIILGLICGLIGDILLDLKVMYPFHEDNYLRAGMISFGVGHLFYITALLNLVSTEIDIKTQWLQLLIVLCVAIIVCLLVWLISIKVLKLNFGKNTLITNLYSFVLLLTTILSVYLCFIGLSYKMYIMAIGFVLFLLSDLVLSTQYFGGKQNDKKLIIVNHTLYYLAQIVIATFIYFI